MAGSAIVDIRTSFGAIFVGLLFSTTLFGLTLAQTWLYFWHYHDRDPKALKFFIAFITILDVLHTATSAYVTYWYLVLNFGNIGILDITLLAFSLQIILTAIISGFVQLFYARRVYILSKSVVFPILIVALAAVALSFGIFYTARDIALGSLFKFHSLIWIACIALTSHAMTDVLIAGSMCWYLYRQRTGFSRTDSTLSILMVYSINTGLLTCVLAVAVAISAVVSPASLISIAILWVLSKCCVNSLLAMLNSRDYIRDRSTTDNLESTFKLSSIRIKPLSEARQPSVSINVHHSTITDYGRNPSDHDVEPTLDNRKSGTSIVPFQRLGRSSESSA